ncbi:sperm-tail PG-rich repeat-containing protein 2-like [Babylonia areolata]|uniref:sperm-tail PG-rich repeat-containing protein 2-like n=1 Tax=Babylonia areolata TaxID=304850 RepID=UPI003FD153B9
MGPVFGASISLVEFYDQLADALNVKLLGAVGAPAPGSYEVVKSYDRSQVHTEMAKPRTLAASLKHSSFVCCAPRFQAGNRQAVPGPGTYECKETLRKKRAPIVSTDQRFQYRVNNFPGPGTYEFTPAVRDSILKGTFNVTLNNPLMAPPSSPPVSAARALSPAIQIA